VTRELEISLSMKWTHDMAHPRNATRSPDWINTGASTVTVSMLVSACVILNAVLRVERVRLYGSRFVVELGLSFYVHQSDQKSIL
jgi:hypothetical protein